MACSTAQPAEHDVQHQYCCMEGNHMRMCSVFSLQWSWFDVSWIVVRLPCSLHMDSFHFWRSIRCLHVPDDFPILTNFLISLSNVRILVHHPLTHGQRYRSISPFAGRHLDVISLSFARFHLILRQVTIVTSFYIWSIKSKLLSTPLSISSHPDHHSQCCYVGFLCPRLPLNRRNHSLWWWWDLFGIDRQFPSDTSIFPYYPMGTWSLFLFPYYISQGCFVYKVVLSSRENDNMAEDNAQ